MTPPPPPYDVAVVGGGIVGLATAMALAERARRTVIVLEAEDRLAAHQSGRNSGVIHSGLYYDPGSLKARTCREGRDAMYAFCHEEGVPCRRTGKLVVATRADELPRLSLLEERGRANGLHGLRRLDPAALREIEPEARGVAALWVEETGVVGFAAVAAAYARRVERAGGEVRTSARVHAVRRDGAGLVLETARGEVRAALLVNCAGLHCDRVARLCGVEPGVHIVPFRGEYYELRPERRDLVRNLVYPVPDPALPFLGVHFTRTIDGRVEAGPNAVLALKREGYRRWDVSLPDLFDTVLFPGFWRMARQHWHTGLDEWRRSLSPRRFVEALQRLVPAVQETDVRPAGSGVRAQAVDAAGRLLSDFHIVADRRSVHVLNAPSPAATASIAIGRAVAAQALEQLKS
jgi:(S)-2-hydroxyglutarate dehydrogenase